MFKIFYLSECGYSKKSLEILKKYKLTNQSNKINCDNRDNFSQDPDSKYIPSDYFTYPKILYLPTGPSSDPRSPDPVFVGGNSELEKFINLVVSKEIVGCENIPPQRFVNKFNTCKIIIDLIKIIYPN